MTHTHTPGAEVRRVQHGEGCLMDLDLPLGSPAALLLRSAVLLVLARRGLAAGPVPGGHPPVALR